MHTFKFSLTSTPQELFVGEKFPAQKQRQANTSVINVLPQKTASMQQMIEWFSMILPTLSLISELLEI